jgi:DNA-binding CsgD family transcriptional regulator
MGRRRKYGAPLSPREREVASWIATGLSRQQIAHQLGVGEETVKTHLQNIYSKTGVTSRHALALIVHSISSDTQIG